MDGPQEYDFYSVNNLDIGKFEIVTGRNAKFNVP